MKETSCAADTQRHPSIPIEYIVSETVAFPLATVASFENHLVALDPEMKSQTGRLWRSAERHLTRIGPDISIDMLLAIRDHFWFVPETSTIHKTQSHGFGLDCYLRRLTKKFFELRGSHAVPRSPASELLSERGKGIPSTNQNNKTLRWLSYSLPVDLLLGASDCKTCPPNAVEYTSSQMNRNLKDNGLIEPHLHVGAAMQFSEFWVAVLNRLASTDLHEEAFKSPGAEMDEGKKLAPWLLRAAITRLFLARFLYRNHHCADSKCEKNESPENFDQYFHRVILREITRSRGNGSAAIVLRVMRELQAGKFLPYNELKFNAFLQSCYRSMINPRFATRLNDHPDTIHLCDPISRLTRYAQCQSPHPEICFIHNSLRYLQELRQQNRKDRSFEALFWQVVRLRCLFYRHVTQRPMTPGLLWFVRHYNRMGPGRKNANVKLLVRSAARNCGRGQGLRALEVRTSPEKNIRKMLRLTQDSVEALQFWNFHHYFDPSFRSLPHPFQPQKLSRYHEKTAERIEFGWIIHFVKLRGETSKNGLDRPWWQQTNADPQQPIKKPRSKLTCNRDQYRYAQYYLSRRVEAMVLGKLLLNYPRSLKVIRAIDCCTDEIGVPGWVLAPIFRYLTEAGKAASQHLKVRFGEEVPPLRKTVHCGEDFPHLIGGLRRIYEAVHFFNLSAGDRIGHGMALGINPETWANRNGRLAMRLEDRLFDLVWEWSQYSVHAISCAPGRIAHVSQQIACLSKEIFGRSYAPLDLERLAANLYNEDMLKAAGFPEEVHYRVKHKTPSKESERQMDENQSAKHSENEDLDLLRRYLKDPKIFKRGHQVKWVSVIPEIESMTALQNNLRQTIGSLGIVVEVNPSSNLLIGNIADLRNHPLWRLFSPMGNDDVPPVAICIGSDDPLTFSTDLRREYALVYESLIDSGLSAQQAWDWVEKVRRTGMNSRFTLPVEEPQNRFRETGCRYLDKYRVTDSRLPLSYWVLGLGKHINGMP